MKKPLIISDNNLKSKLVKKQILSLFKNNQILKKNVVIVIGGDGFMLKTLKKIKKQKKYFMVSIQVITVS